MNINNKKLNKVLIISNSIFLILLITITITNYKNYTSYINSTNKLTDTNNKIKEYKAKITELNKKLTTNESKKIAQINQCSTDFLNAYFNYDALSKDKIYDNIKPYATDYLVNKLEPNKENQLESDVNYKVYIQNIRLYSKSIQGENDASILVLADEGIQTKSSDSSSPLLVELKFRYVNNKWLVDDLEINTPLQNKSFID